MEGKWRVICEPHEENPGPDGKNQSGLVVKLTNGDITRETSRVGFSRRNTANPKKSFDYQLQKEIDKAQSAADQMNALLYEEPDRELL